jgi:hypothetical protein
VYIDARGKLVYVLHEPDDDDTATTDATAAAGDSATTSAAAAAAVDASDVQLIDTNANASSSSSSNISSAAEPKRFGALQPGDVARDVGAKPTAEAAAAIAAAKSTTSSSSSSSAVGGAAAKDSSSSSSESTAAAAVVAAAAPLPRINPALAVRGNTLYVYGGLLEVKDREYTLDDCWALELNTRYVTLCITLCQPCTTLRSSALCMISVCLDLLFACVWVISDCGIQLARYCGMPL